MINSFTGVNRFLSNFYPVWVELDKVKYPSVEHAYQAAKTLDPLLRQTIQEAKTAGEAKRLGKKIAVRLDWNEKVRLQVMSDLLVQKFKTPELRNKLLATDKLELIEGNCWGDTFWGVCKGQGKNYLGKLLMQIREELRAF